MRRSLPVRVYRVLDPVAAAHLFDFTSGDGHEAIKEMLAHVCLGELRSVVALMTMSQCIEQRKTTLTDAIASALQALIEGGTDHTAERVWGIDPDVVQVAQVFLVDDELRRHLQAERWIQIRTTSQISDLQTTEQLRLSKEVEARRVEKDLLEPTATQALRMEILPVEQMTDVARSMSDMLPGANLTMYGEGAKVLARKRGIKFVQVECRTGKRKRPRRGDPWSAHRRITRPRRPGPPPPAPTPRKPARRSAPENHKHGRVHTERLWCGEIPRGGRSRLNPHQEHRHRDEREEE